MHPIHPALSFAGYDVACKVIEDHKRNFASHPNWNFECMDLSLKLPTSPDDLDNAAVFSRDALQHLPMAFVRSYLDNVRKSGVRWLLVGSYVKTQGGNRDIAPGDYYAIDLTKPPFNLRPPPIEVVDEQTPDGKHILMFDARAMQWD